MARWKDRRAVTAVILTLILIGFFFPFLIRLLRLAQREELYSHLPLIPVVSVYLVCIARGKACEDGRASWGLAALFAAMGGAAIAWYGWVVSGTEGLLENDLLFWPVASLILFFYAVVAGWGGRRAIRAWWFELMFLLFFIPLPTPVVTACSISLQYASASALDGVLGLTGTTYFRQGQVFQFPGLTLDVAIECSGIRSTLVLFITALLAGHLFLRRPWQKIALILAVVPLGILRNAVRITVLALLTVHVDPGIIDSPLHHRGGPIFFVLSLVVLFALIFLLRGIGRKPRPAVST